MSAGLSHGREAGVQYDEALRQQRMCRELRRRTALSDVLKKGHSIVADLLEDFEEQNDFMAVFDPPPIMRECRKRHDKLQQMNSCTIVSLLEFVLIFFFF